MFSDDVHLLSTLTDDELEIVIKKELDEMK